jgi:hypothetical protein
MEANQEKPDNFKENISLNLLGTTKVSGHVVTGLSTCLALPYCQKSEVFLIHEQ